MDTHFLENIYFSAESRPIKAIAGNTHNQHAARFRVAIEHSDIHIAHVCQIVSTAHTGWSGPDHGDFFFIGFIDGATIQRCRDIRLYAFEILLGDEFFDFVDSKCLIYRTAGAGIFAAAVADMTTDGGEGVILLDELQSIQITSFFRQLDITLNGDVCRACRLAGGST